MNSMKKAYTIDQQIARLKSNGMTFDERRKRKRFSLMWVITDLDSILFHTK